MISIILSFLAGGVCFRQCQRLWFFKRARDQVDYLSHPETGNDSGTISTVERLNAPTKRVYACSTCGLIGRNARTCPGTYTEHAALYEDSACWVE